MSAVLPQAVYRRVKEPRELPGELRLRALEWALYFSITGRHTAAELGRRMRAGDAERDEAFGRLARLGLIEEQELDASEYVSALAAADDREEKSLREFLLGAAQPAAEPLSRPLSPVPSSARTPRPLLAFKPLPLPDAQAKEKREMSRPRRLSLRALMDLIERKAGSREAGQLDIYRVFVRVDTALLKRNGIETLRFTEDRLVSDPELERAIVRSVKKTLAIDCPDSVWVDVA
jgi:hypothetical protein